MKPKVSEDLSWLPPGEEWDFRSILKDQCRVACHWEYSRELRKRSSEQGIWEVAKTPGSPQKSRIAAVPPYVPSNYRQVARDLFPRPWTTLSKEQRQDIVESFHPIPALQVRKLGDFMERMRWGANTPASVMQPYLDYSYVILPNFTSHGVEAVIKEFEAWARKEAKSHGRSPRAKAAELPFDELKWLAVLRLEQARTNSKIGFQQAQDSLAHYRAKQSLADPNGVFPTYASHGAWSKARKDAQRVLMNAGSRSSPMPGGLR